MKVVRLGSRDVVVGLDWVPLPANVPESKGIKAHLSAIKSKGARYGVVLDGPPVTLGLAPPGVKKPKQPSAAALLAIANQLRQENADERYTMEEANWIVVEPVGDGDQLWFAVIKEGTPLPTSDIVDSREAILQELSELLALSNEFTVISSDAEVRRQASATSRTSDESIDILLGEGKDKAARLKRISGNAMLWVALLGLVLLMFVAYFAFSKYQEKRAQEAAAAAAAAQQATTQQQIAVDKKNYQAAVQIAAVDGLKAGVKEVEDLLGGPRPDEVIAAWQSLIDGVNLYQSGWQLKDMNCLRDTPVDLSCTVNLERGQVGVNRILAEDRPDVAFEGEKAHYTLRTGGLKTHAFSWNDDLVTTRDFMLGMLSDLQNMRGGGITHNVEESKEVVKDVAIPTPPASIFSPGNADVPVSSTVQIQMGVATGKITLTGKELWQIGGVLDVVNRPNVVIKTLDVKLDGSMSWTMVMDYYVRSKPQPVMPMITTADGPITINLPPEFAARVAEEDTGKMSASSISATDPETQAQQAKEKEMSGGPPLPMAPPPQTFEEEGQ